MLDLSGLSAWTDENKMDLIKASVLKGRTADIINVQGGIKNSATINIIGSTLVAQAGACGWGASGSTALTQRTITVCDIKVNESICLNDLEDYYTSTMMNPGSYNENIPFEQIYAEEKADQVQALVEDLIWRGDTVALVPTDVIDVDDLKLFMSYPAFRILARAYRDANLFNYQINEGNFRFMLPGTNVEAVAVRGLNGQNDMVLTPASNLSLGTDLLNDSENFKIFYSQDNDEVRFLAKWKQGTGIAFPQFVVHYAA